MAKHAKTKLMKRLHVRLASPKSFSTALLMLVVVGFVGYLGYRLIASFAAGAPSVKLTIRDNTNAAIGTVTQSSTTFNPPAAPTYTVKQFDDLQFAWSTGNVSTCKKWRDWSNDDGSPQGYVLASSGSSDRGIRDTATATQKDIYLTCDDSANASDDVSVHILVNVTAQPVTTPPSSPPPSNPPASTPPASTPPASNPSNGGDTGSNGGSGSTSTGSSDSSSSTGTGSGSAGSSSTGSHSSSGSTAARTSNGAPVVTAAPTASDPGPNAPDNFTANSNVVGVILSWTAASGGDGALTYSIDRSTDDATWTNVATSLTGTVYADTSSDFSTAYTYRIQAIDAKNVGSPYIQTQITTQDFSSNVTSGGSNITSDDGVITAVIPAGAVDSSASCAIVSQSMDAKSSKGSPTIVAGPYNLACRTSDDNTITSFNSPVTFSAKISSALAKKYHGFTAESQSGSKWSVIKGSKYTSKDGTVSFSLSSDALFGIAASKGTSLAVWLTIVFFLAIVGAGGYVLYKRKDAIVEWFYQH